MRSSIVSSAHSAFNMEINFLSDCFNIIVRSDWTITSKLTNLKTRFQDFMAAGTQGDLTTALTMINNQISNAQRALDSAECGDRSYVHNFQNALVDLRGLIETANSIIERHKSHFQQYIYNFD